MVAFDLSIGSLREIICKDHSLENISGHTFVSVVNDKTKGFPNYDHPTDSYTDLTTKTNTIEKPKLKLTKSVSKDGIYCFGGINAKGELNNNLMYFSIDTKTPNWNRVLTKGSPPAQRYLHTMEYCPELSCLVLFGGRKEKIDLKQKQFCFNDLWLFYIQSSQWQEINFNSNGPEARHCHVSCMYGTKLLIFGGINPKGLCSPNTYIIELKKEL